MPEFWEQYTELFHPSRAIPNARFSPPPFSSAVSSNYLGQELACGMFPEFRHKHEYNLTGEPVNGYMFP